jgi:hypothetical protein
VRRRKDATVFLRIGPICAAQVEYWSIAAIKKNILLWTYMCHGYTLGGPKPKWRGLAGSSGRSTRAGYNPKITLILSNEKRYNLIYI